MRENIARKITMLVMAAVLLGGVGYGVSEAISVSNTVNGRELPIYSVETPEKKVALSFDAAWGKAQDGLFEKTKETSANIHIRQLYVRFQKRLRGCIQK